MAVASEKVSKNVGLNAHLLDNFHEQSRRKWNSNKGIFNLLTTKQ